MTTIVKTTSKGQVTLPVAWRRRFRTSRYALKEQGDTLVISPLDIELLEKENWKTVFDARRDNDGNGIPIDKLIKVLKKTL